MDSREIINAYATSISEYFFMASFFYITCYKLFGHALKESKIQKKTLNSSDIRREIINSLLSTFIMSLTIVTVINTDLVKYTQWYTDINQHSWWWIPGAFIMGLIIHDTYFYWLHRLLHIKSIFKYAHLTHHKSTNPTPYASYSFHFLEALGEALIVPIIIVLLPFHPISLLLFLVSSLFINAYGHLGYEIAPKWLRGSFLFTIITTSTYHNLHHSKFKGNYGLYFRFWDKMLGTEYANYEDVYDEIQNRRFPG